MPLQHILLAQLEFTIVGGSLFDRNLGSCWQMLANNAGKSGAGGCLRLSWEAWLFAVRSHGTRVLCIGADFYVCQMAALCNRLRPTVGHVMYLPRRHQRRVCDVLAFVSNMRIYEKFSAMPTRG